MNAFANAGMRAGAPHIGLFLPSLAGGGAERVMLALAAAFTRRFVQVDLLVASATGELVNQIPAAVNLINFNKRKSIHAAAQLAGYLRRSRPDALLATVLPANVAASIAVLVPGIETRLILREANFPEYDTIGRRPLDTFINRFMVRLLYPRADKLIAMSHAMKQSLCAFHGSLDLPVAVIPNPYLRAPGSIDPAQTVARKPGADSAPLILWAGRLERQKDPLTMLQAFALLRARMPVRLAMLGEGALRTSIEQQVQALGIDADVELPGFVHEIPLWMQQCRLFVHSARWEGFANVLVEALAHARPVVATDCPGAVREILGDGRFGAMVPVENPEQMALAMEAVLNGSLQFEDPEKHLRQFDIESIADQYLELLIGDVCRPRSRPPVCAG